MPVRPIRRGKRSNSVSAVRAGLAAYGALTGRLIILDGGRQCCLDSVQSRHPRHVSRPAETVERSGTMGCRLDRAATANRYRSD